ncbi:MAG: polysaccharide biosynthesis protein [Clostridiales bacterium]|nr:polysaccharide biosynthesis protein [Clostridiales bacterium]
MRQFSLFLKGTLILTIAGLLSRFLGFFYKIFLAQALGAEGMGIYQLIFPVFSVCHALTASGIETAISRFTAFHQKRDHSGFLYAGLFASLAASFAVSFLLWTQAPFIARYLLHETRCTPLLRILAAVVPLSCVHSCFAGSYLGRKKAGIPAAAQILEQSIRIGTVWLLCSIYMQQGRTVTPALAAFGMLAGELGSALFMLTFASGSWHDFFHINKYLSKCRTLLGMALPLTGSRLSLTLLQSTEAVLIPLNLRRSGLSVSDSLSMYGILTGMALSFLMFPNAVTSSISAMLLPVISEEQACGNRQSISAAIEYTIQFGLSIGILCMGIFLRYGGDLGTFFFHERLAGEFLTTLSWICPFLYLTGNLHSILHGLGNTSVTFFNQLSGILVRILFTIFLVPSYGIAGVLWGILASQLLLCILGIRAIAPYVTPSLGLDILVLKPLAALILSIGGISLLKHLFPVLNLGLQILNLTISICMVAAAYFILLILFGAWKLTGLQSKKTVL